MSLNINEKMRNEKKMEKKVGDVPRKFLIFPLVTVLKSQTWYQTNAKIPTFYLIRYANYLSIIYIYINENIRNERESWKNIYEDVPKKLLISQ